MGTQLPDIAWLRHGAFGYLGISSSSVRPPSTCESALANSIASEFGFTAAAAAGTTTTRSPALLELATEEVEEKTLSTEGVVKTLWIDRDRCP